MNDNIAYELLLRILTISTEYFIRFDASPQRIASFRVTISNALLFVQSTVVYRELRKRRKERAT